jgi:hypothetical protein
MADTPEEIAADLRDEALITSGESMRNGCQRCGIAASIANDAADMIERQAAEIARLKAGGCARDQTTTQYCAEAAAFAAEIDRLRAELGAATGYMLNAKIDLETGAPKRTAIATIEGGLRRARAAVLPSPPAER